MPTKRNDPTPSFTNILVIEIKRVHDLTVFIWCQRLSDAGESKLGYELRIFGQKPVYPLHRTQRDLEVNKQC